VGISAVAIVLYVVVGPLWVARYPMMTDLPFHTACSAIFRHYFDPAWHFREQFTLQPIAVPYLALYVVAAALMLVLPTMAAMKVAIALMLGLLPVGLGVMFWGMRKSPLLGLTGLGLVWCGLTSWGFLNFMAALGLFAMVVGLTLRLCDRPSRNLKLGLALALCGVFFSHVFRFPFALCAVVGSAVAVFPATRRLRPIVLPLLAPLALLALWWWLRPAALGGELGPLRLEPKRLDEIGSYLYRSFRDPAELRAATHALHLLGVVGAAAALLFVAQGRLGRRRGRELAWGVGVTLVPLGCAGIFLLLYLMLPMQVGVWWYVYPREITAAAFVALGALPDLPRQSWLKALFVAAMASAVVPLGRVAIDNYAKFDAATADFDAVIRQVPDAPKLLYLVFDHSGATAVSTPFIHLPAYVQAIRGGWLSFHFAGWGAAPVAYRAAREPGAVVPPPTPLRWEWTPDRFRVLQHGPFFDWFLVRSRRAPDDLFRADPTIARVAHEGTWWLYRRRGTATAAPAR
jgi:hypothetical protein